MTTNIERQFFDTFGIEPKEKVNQTFNGAEFKVETIKEYPQITDRILLELICIANHNGVYVNLEGPNIETIKNHLLEYFIFFRRDVKKYVQKLFKEG
jgi:hypothetical protein